MELHLRTTGITFHIRTKAQEGFLLHTRICYDFSCFLAETGAGTP